MKEFAKCVGGGWVVEERGTRACPEKVRAAAAKK